MTGLTEETLDALRKHLDPEDRSVVPDVLNVGFSNVVIRFGQSLVRLARNPRAAAGHRREAAILPVLVDRLTVAVPAPIRLLAAEPAMPHGAAIYPFLPGSVMAPDHVQRWPGIAGDIGRALFSLHGTVETLFPPGALPTLDPIAELHKQERAIGWWLQARLSERRWHRLRSLWERSIVVFSTSERAVCHADAWYGNMVVQEGALVGLLDWENACVADPAVDFAPQQYLGRAAAHEVLETYVALSGRTPPLQDRIECYRLLREVGGVAYVLGEGMEDEYEDALAKVTRLLD